MSRSRWHRIQVGVSLAALCFAVGCSTLPTAPQVRTESGAAPARTEEPRSPGAALIQSATSTKTITGLLGGTVSAGKFKVVIPPLALAGTATVTVTQSDLSQPVVDLAITPASANRFRVPVILIADASGMGLKTLSVSYISYFNPATGAWQRVVGSSIDLKLLTVQAPLWHFSTYRVESKAGW
jgi:hypothetical protein